MKIFILILINITTKFTYFKNKLMLFFLFYLTLNIKINNLTY